MQNISRSKHFYPRMFHSEALKGFWPYLKWHVPVFFRCQKGENISSKFAVIIILLVRLKLILWCRNVLQMFPLSLSCWPGVPNPRAVAHYRAAACSDLSRRSGGWVQTSMCSTTCMWSRWVSVHTHLHLCEQWVHVPAACANGAAHACCPSFSRNHPLCPPSPGLQSRKGWKPLMLTTHIHRHRFAEILLLFHYSYILAILTVKMPSQSLLIKTALLQDTNKAECWRKTCHIIYKIYLNNHDYIRN